MTAKTNKINTSSEKLIVSLPGLFANGMIIFRLALSALNTLPRIHSGDSRDTGLPLPASYAFQCQHIYA